MNPILAVLMPILLTMVFGFSYIVVWEMIKERTLSKFVGALCIAFVGALCLDLAFNIIIGN